MDIPPPLCYNIRKAPAGKTVGERRDCMDYSKTEIFRQCEERGTFRIHSDTKVVIGTHVHLTASDRLQDYETDDTLFHDPCGNELGRSLLYANRADHIEITGEEGSILDGKGMRWKTEDKKHRRPRQQHAPAR